MHYNLGNHLIKKQLNENAPSEIIQSNCEEAQIQSRN
jgi:hypothetical protein